MLTLFVKPLKAFTYLLNVISCLLLFRLTLPGRQEAVSVNRTGGSECALRRNITAHIGYFLLIGIHVFIMIIT